MLRKYMSFMLRNFENTKCLSISSSVICIMGKLTEIYSVTQYPLWLMFARFSYKKSLSVLWSRKSQSGMQDSLQSGFSLPSGFLSSSPSVHCFHQRLVDKLYQFICFKNMPCKFAPVILLTPLMAFQAELFLRLHIHNPI